MVALPEFAVERWMDEYELDAKYNLAETCCASISMDDLVALSDTKSNVRDIVQAPRKLTYGAIRGSEALRTHIGETFALNGSARLTPENVLLTPGAIAANFQVILSLVGPGDHVVCHYPTYQQLYSVPESLGAEVSLWRSDPFNDWRLDIQSLEGMIRKNTKLIIINNPQNPTGAVLPSEALAKIVEIAKGHNIYIHCDEVYRPLFHGLGIEQFPQSILSFGYEKTVSTGSMSKAYSLAGIRVGWIASNCKELVDRCASTRDYTTISVSQIDDQVAAFALRSDVRTNLMRRNIELARENLSSLEEFVNEFSWACDWVKPLAGTTAMIRFKTKSGQPVDDVMFCKQLQAEVGVMFVPASLCFGDGKGFHGYVRVGFVPDRQVLVDGLNALRQFMTNGYAKVPASASST